MAFKQAEAEDLLVRAGRMCAICHRRHGVQLHHIVPSAERGPDDIDNAIPLCANCHDEVHASGAIGRVSRKYSVTELKGHRSNVIKLAKRQASLSPGSPDAENDRTLVVFFAQVLDRPAFRTPFHLEVSFEDFDRALEDTSIALNTGHWRMRDGTPLRAAEGRVALVNPYWRAALDEIAGYVDEARTALRRALGLGEMLYRFDDHHAHAMDTHLRGDQRLAREIDEYRTRAVESMNGLLTEIGLKPLKQIGDGW